MTHGRINDIEVLRAVAVTTTLILHLSFFLVPTWNGAALFSYLDFRIGVDLFFAISGYVIAKSALPKFQGGWQSGQFWRNTFAFWVRRAWRIWPSAWLWLAIILTLTIFFNESGIFGRDSASIRGTVREVVASILQVMNFNLTSTTIMNPGSVMTGSGSIFPYWSLSLEEQFYLALPLVVLVSRKYLPLVLLVVVAALFTIPKGPGQPWSFFRLDPIILGVLIAMWQRNPSYKLLEPTFLGNGSIRKIGFTLGVSALAAAAMALNIVSFAHGLTSLLCALLVYVASFDKDYLFPAWRVRRLLLWIGSRSYAMYLSHVVLFQLTYELWFLAVPLDSRPFTRNYELRYGVTALLLVIIASELNFRFIEEPFRRRGRRIADDMERGTRDPETEKSPSAIAGGTAELRG